MLSLRLKPVGKKKVPQYDVVVTDIRSPRDGKFIEKVGYFHPLSVGSSRINLKMERINYWLSVGAQTTEKVKHILKDFNKNYANTNSQPKVDSESVAKES